MWRLQLGVKYRLLNLYCSLRLYSKKGTNLADCTMKILNVAEKNDAAKNISALLSGNRAQRVMVFNWSHSEY